MALVKCKQCDGIVAQFAQVCPHCGGIPTIWTFRPLHFLALIVAVTIGLILLTQLLVLMR